MVQERYRVTTADEAVVEFDDQGEAEGYIETHGGVLAVIPSPRMPDTPDGTPPGTG
jgi:hypothetical protein